MPTLPVERMVSFAASEGPIIREDAVLFVIFDPMAIALVALDVLVNPNAIAFACVALFEEPKESAPPALTVFEYPTAALCAPLAVFKLPMATPELDCVFPIPTEIPVLVCKITGAPLMRYEAPVAMEILLNVLVAVVDVAVKFAATTSPTTLNLAYGDVVPMPKLPEMYPVVVLGSNQKGAVVVEDAPMVTMSVVLRE